MGHEKSRFPLKVSVRDSYVATLDFKLGCQPKGDTPPCVWCMVACFSALFELNSG